MMVNESQPVAVQCRVSFYSFYSLDLYIIYIFNHIFVFIYVVLFNVFNAIKYHKILKLVLFVCIIWEEVHS